MWRWKQKLNRTGFSKHCHWHHCCCIDLLFQSSISTHPLYFGEIKPMGEVLCEDIESCKMTLGGSFLSSSVYKVNQQTQWLSRGSVWQGTEKELSWESLLISSSTGCCSAVCHPSYVTFFLTPRMPCPGCLPLSLPFSLTVSKGLEALCKVT